jgi:Fe-S cluster assembly iron-binding protein IscA
VVEQDGARVMIAPMAQMFLFGTEIDYETGLLESGFKFRNPNVVEPAAAASRSSSRTWTSFPPGRAG